MKYILSVSFLLACNVNAATGEGEYGSRVVKGVVRVYHQAAVDLKTGPEHIVAGLKSRDWELCKQGAKECLAGAVGGGFAGAGAYQLYQAGRPHEASSFGGPAFSPLPLSIGARSTRVTAAAGTIVAGAVATDKLRHYLLPPADKKL